MKVQSFHLSFECEAKCYKHYCRNNKKNWRVKFLNFLLSDEQFRYRRVLRRQDKQKQIEC